MASSPSHSAESTLINDSRSYRLVQVPDFRGLTQQEGPAVKHLAFEGEDVVCGGATALDNTHNPLLSPPAGLTYLDVSPHSMPAAALLASPQAAAPLGSGASPLGSVSPPLGSGVSPLGSVTPSAGENAHGYIPRLVGL